MAAPAHRRSHFADPHSLVRTEYNSTSRHTCDICRSKLAGLTGYRCNACDFDIHDACADYFEQTISFFAHPWHDLTLTRMPGSCVGWVCDLCGEECPPGHFVYRCRRCAFDVHPVCTMLPQTISQHPLHPAHELCMAPSWGSCSACRKGLDIWHYRCGFCLFKLHIACASGEPATGGEQAGAGAAASAATPTTTTSRTAIAKFLLETSLSAAVDAATGGLASQVLEVLDEVLNN